MGPSVQPSTAHVLRGMKQDIDDAVAELELQLAKLRKQQDGIQAELAAIRYPVLTLPPELICKIFKSAVATVDNVYDVATVLLKITAVCRLWRETAIADPTLWTTLTIDCARSDPAALFECFLSRTGSLPIDITAHIPTSDYLGDIPASFWGASTRWRKLELTSAEATLVLPTPGPLPHSSLGNAGSRHLRRAVERRWVHWFQISAQVEQQLRNLTLTQPHSLFDIHLVPSLGTLEELCLPDAHVLPAGPSAPSSLSVPRFKLHTITCPASAGLFLEYFHLPSLHTIHLTSPTMDAMAAIDECLSRSSSVVTTISLLDAELEPAKTALWLPTLQSVTALILKPGPMTRSEEKELVLELYDDVFPQLRSITLRVPVAMADSVGAAVDSLTWSLTRFIPPDVDLEELVFMRNRVKARVRVPNDMYHILRICGDKEPSHQGAFLSGTSIVDASPAKDALRRPLTPYIQMPFLPDEILALILSTALKVDDDAFSDLSRIDESPFVTFSHSISSLLLVSKSWLRVATPLLYHVVILRTKPQVKSLADALVKSPFLGKFVRKLRVEGGYSAPMQKILKLVPKVTELYLSFDIYAQDSVDGLCKGLGLIQPTRLILNQTRGKRNRMTERLVETLAACIGNWERLTILEISEDRRHSLVPSVNGPIADALVAAGKRLDTVCVQSMEAAEWALEKLKECSPHCIRAHLEQSRLKPAQLELLRALRPQLEKRKTLLLFDDDEAEDIDARAAAAKISAYLPPNADFVPLNSAPPAIRDDIWSFILGFVWAGINDASFSISATADLLLVSTAFKRAAEPHMYHTILLFSHQQTVALHERLKARPILGTHIRRLELYHSAWGGEDEPKRRFGSHMNHILNAARMKLRLILRAATNLEVLRTDGCDLAQLDSSDAFEPDCNLDLSWRALETLATIDEEQSDVMRSLKVLSVSFVPRGSMFARESVASLARFVSLRKLVWRSSVELDSCPLELMQLEELHILTCSKSFFALMSNSAFPALRRLSFAPHTPCNSLVDAHGKKLTFLCISMQAVKALAQTVSILECCPNLVCLNVIWKAFGNHSVETAEPLPLDALTPSYPVHHLTKIKFVLPPNQLKKESDLFRRWEAYFSDFSLHYTPKLRAIQMTALEWPTNPRDFEKNVWVPVANEISGIGVKLVDMHGNAWIPRLKAPLRGKKGYSS
ncbi:HEME-HALOPEROXIDASE domain-containing protein [Mycena kentingensis (nom. inval.)]|nr:HEME-HALOPEROXIDASE domain-containing protein [Mycena kentingensis (nom. inval.)]